MIQLADVSKAFMTGGLRRVVADRINLTLPAEGAVALIGRNGAGKSSLLKLISGTMQPDSGRITVDGSVSWPVGFAGSFHGDLSGRQNTRFVARVYGIDTDALETFVFEFSDLKSQFHQPFRTYSSGMKARLAFAVSMGIDFDTYLIDEVTSVGDAAFRKKSEELLAERLGYRAAVVVSHSMPLLQRICRSAIMLENGHAQWFDCVDDAIRAHRECMKTA
ncbi:MAG: ABC transporter ATP-binding protein [Boseongicola sp.]